MARLGVGLVCAALLSVQCLGSSNNNNSNNDSDAPEVGTSVLVFKVGAHADQEQSVLIDYPETSVASPVPQKEHQQPSPYWEPAHGSQAGEDKQRPYPPAAGESHYETCDDPHRQPYDEQQHHQSYDDPHHQSYDEQHHQPYDDQQQQHQAYDEQHQQSYDEQQHQSYDKPYHHAIPEPYRPSNAEPRHEKRPEYEEGERSDSRTESKESGGLRVGPDPLNPLAPYLLPSTDTLKLARGASRQELEGIRGDLQDSYLIPEVLSDTFDPEFPVTVCFDGEEIQLGQLLGVAQTQNEPTIEFDAPPGQYFAVAIVDPDAPSVSRHGYRSYRHYLLGNMSTRSFDTLTPYEPPSPSQGPAHRYLVVVLRQHGHIAFDQDDVPDSRVRFDVVKWGREHNMKPVAATYFMAKRSSSKKKARH